MTKFTDALTETGNATDTPSVSVDFAPTITETGDAIDTLVGNAEFNVSVNEAGEAVNGLSATAFYWHFPDWYKRKRVELRSAHDVLTRRARVSDPTENKDTLLRYQIPRPRR